MNIMLFFIEAIELRFLVLVHILKDTYLQVQASYELSILLYSY